MGKNASFSGITILVVFLTLKCQNAMMDWPATTIASKDTSGFFLKLQISNDYPKDN